MKRDKRTNVTARGRLVEIAATGTGHRCRRHLVRRGAVGVALCVAFSAAAALLEFDEYLQRADAARQRADWQSVASQLAQAINHPDLPATGARRSAVHLEYARAVGVFCHYEEAEKYLLLARDIAQAAGSPTFDAEFERGVMHAARGDYVRAAGILEPLARKTTTAGGSGPPAQRLVLLHEQLAVVLAALNRSEEAATYRERAKSLRTAHPTVGLAAGDGLAPYGSQCRKR